MKNAANCKARFIDVSPFTLDAKLAVRLVSADRDVLWSTTQESKGAKYKGSGADVADQVVKHLMHDIEKLQPPGK